MSIAAQAAVRAWINGRDDLTDGQGGGVLPAGAHVERLRSPASGAYAVVERIQAEGSGGLFAEDDSVTNARIAAYVYAGKRETAELAAAALATAESSLTGVPVVVEAAGQEVKILVCADVVGPVFQDQPPDSGEQFCFTVTATFVLAAG